jgi:hypothetical protein
MSAGLSLVYETQFDAFEREVPSLEVSRRVSHDGSKAVDIYLVVQVQFLVWYL